MSLRVKVIQLLDRKKGPICDDCIARILDVNHRQQIYQCCEGLSGQLKISRSKSECIECSKEKKGSESIKASKINSPKPKKQAKKIQNRFKENNPPDLSNTIPFNISCLLKWKTVEQVSGRAYIFSDRARFNNNYYRRPAIYRWVMLDKKSGLKRPLYIGETENLERRINHYQNPGPSQMTNIRINEESSSLMNEGNHICIECLMFDQISLSDIKLTMNDLDSKNTRRFLEYLLITYYEKLGYSLQNR